MTIERKLQNIVDSKEQIKSAIENKGVTVGNAPLSQYADKVNEIQSGGSEVSIEEGIIMKNPELINGEKFFTEADIFSKSGVIPRNLTNQYEFNKDENEIEIPRTSIMNVKLNDNISEVGEYGLTGTHFDDYSKFMEGLIIRKGAFYGSTIKSSIIESASVLGFRSLSFSTIEGNLTASEKLTGQKALYGATINGVLTLDIEAIKDMFAAESTMQDLVFSKNVKTLSGYCFRDANIGKDGTYNLIIPEGVSFGSDYYVSYVFSGSNIRSAITPTTMVFSDSKGDSMFFNCQDIIEANLKGGGRFSSTFRSCYNLQKIILGSPGKPVKSIGSADFKSCKNLTNIEIYVSDISNPPTFAPWGADNATINYLQA